MSIKVLALLLVHASGCVWEWCLSVDLKHVHTFPLSLGWALSPRPAFLSSLFAVQLLCPGSPPGLKPGLVHSLRSRIQETLSIAWCVRGRVLRLRPPLPRLTIPLCLAGQARESTTWRAPAATSFLEESAARVTLRSEGSSTTPVTGDSGKPPLCFPFKSLCSTRAEFRPRHWKGKKDGAAWEVPLHPGDSAGCSHSVLSPCLPYFTPRPIERRRQELPSDRLPTFALETSLQGKTQSTSKPSLPGNTTRSVPLVYHPGTIKRHQAGPGPKSVSPRPFCFPTCGLRYHEKLHLWKFENLVCAPLVKWW